VDDPERDSVGEREESARRALEGFRERRRRRRAEDTYFGSEHLLREALTGGFPAEPDSRRAAILEDARADGVPLDLAELLCDVAWEEGIDPGVAYEIVRTGLGVAPPEGGVSTSESAPAVDKYLPPWMFPATAPDALLRERMLRVSLRRLRGFLEAEPDADEAFRRFANEPDVGHYGY
jgi:hypothetical protein